MTVKKEEGDTFDVKESSSGSDEEVATAAASDAAQKQAAKRRTKTGCLSEYQRLCHPDTLTTGISILICLGTSLPQATVGFLSLNKTFRYSTNLLFYPHGVCNWS